MLALGEGMSWISSATRKNDVKWQVVLQWLLIFHLRMGVSCCTSLGILTGWKDSARSGHTAMKFKHFAMEDWCQDGEK